MINLIGYLLLLIAFLVDKNDPIEFYIGLISAFTALFVFITNLVRMFKRD